MTINVDLLHSFLFVLLIIRQSCTNENINIMDECPPNTKLLDLKTLVPNTKMKYHLMSSDNAHSYFIIKNDVLYSNTLIDMDVMCSKVSECCNKEKESCDFFISVACTENPVSDIIIKKIKVNIRDKNDNYPIFKNKNYDINLSENLKAGHTINLPLATDEDFGINRIENYQIIRQEPKFFDQYFQLNVIKQSTPIKVELKLNKQLDRETISKYSFELMAIDGGYMDRNTGSTNVIIRVLDENDNMPQFTKSLYKETVKEGMANSLPILKVIATDPDEDLNGKILYKFDPISQNDLQIQDNFTINEDTGDISLKQSLDYEKQHSFKFVVIATNPTPSTSVGIPTASATVEIVVENVYDELVEINVDYLTNKNYSTVEENKNNVFVAVITVKSKEADQTRSSINCNLETFTDILNLILKGDENYRSKSYEVRTIAEIDREMLPKIETKIICKDSIDSNIPFTSAPISILVLDQNDNSPHLSIIGDTSVKENTLPGTIVLRIKAVDKDEGENGRVTYSIDKSSHQSLEYLKIGENDGIIRIKTLIDCEANFGPLTSLSVVVTASDHGIPQRTTDFQLSIEVIDVNDNLPKFTINPMVYTILENGPPHSAVGEIEVEDRDVKDEIFLELIHQNPGSFPFTIFKKSSRQFFLNTTRSLDREKESKFEFKVIASNSFVMRGYTVTGLIEVDVLDVNDNPPVIIFPPQNNASVHVISYQEHKNYKFITVSANDQDQSKQFSEVEFQIEGNIDIFDIDRRLGHIYTRRDMTRADIGERTIVITASNTGIPTLKSSVVINIVIDKSPPKSSGNRADSNHKVDPIGESSSGMPGSSEILIIILIVTVCLVVAIIMIFGFFALKHYNKQPICLRNMLDKCYRPEITQVYSPNLKMKNDIEFYKDQNQRHIVEKSTICRDPSDNWSPTNNLVDSYNTATAPNPYPVHGYTHLSNSPQYYFHSHAYQTIEDVDMLNKYPEMNKVMFLQNRGKFDTNYKSELNLNTDNLFYEQNQELSQINEPQKMKWISLNQMPTRSKSVVNRIIPSEQNENSFAVVYPQEQSTFV